MATRFQFPDAASREEADQIPLSESERNALRSFLSRGELRLSTLHRIGAVLLVCICITSISPLFMGDYLAALFQTLRNGISIELIDDVLDNEFLKSGLYLLLLMPVGITLVILFRIQLTIIRNMVMFYFAPIVPGLHSNVALPSLTITGMEFPGDESYRAKRQIFRFQFSKDHVDYILPLSNKERKAQFDPIMQITNDEIIPRTRSVQRLDEEIGLHLSPNEQQDATYVNAAFGLAHTIDRSLAGEVAFLEIHLVRCSNILREVLFHFLQLILFVFWTTLSVTVAMAILKSESNYAIFFLLAANAIWSLVAIKIIALPIKWIQALRSSEKIYADTRIAMVENSFALISKTLAWFSLIVLLFFVFASFSR